MDKNYLVLTEAGERAQNLTRAEAVALAERREREWREVGRTIRARVYYQPTGEEVRS